MAETKRKMLKIMGGKVKMEKPSMQHDMDQKTEVNKPFVIPNFIRKKYGLEDKKKKTKKFKLPPFLLSKYGVSSLTSQQPATPPSA